MKTHLGKHLSSLDLLKINGQVLVTLLTALVWMIEREDAAYHNLFLIYPMLSKAFVNLGSHVTMRSRTQGQPAMDMGLKTCVVEEENTVLEAVRLNVENSIWCGPWWWGL